MGVFGCVLTVGYATYMELVSVAIVVWLQPLNLETPENKFLTRVSTPQPYQSTTQTILSVLSRDQGLGSKHLLHRYLYFHVLRQIIEFFSTSFPDLRNWNRHIIKVIWSTLNRLKTSDSYQTQPCLAQVGFQKLLTLFLQANFLPFLCLFSHLERMHRSTHPNLEQMIITGQM